MRIGYPCLNRRLDGVNARTFRLASYSRERLAATVAANLAGLRRILAFNRENGLLYFRIASEIIPFASHPVCDVDWAAQFAGELAELGVFAREGGMRLTLHPDQFIVLNSPDPAVVRRSVAELEYHALLLDALGVGSDARIQLHVGGVYGDRSAALDRFVKTWDALLPPAVRRRLTVENDDRHYPLADCLALHRRTGVPVLLDVFHHALLNRGETLDEALSAAGATWPAEAGPLLVDYSSQEPGRRPGAHAQTLDEADFAAFLAAASPYDFDLMLEIKDKEASALKALSQVPQ